MKNLSQHVRAWENVCEFACLRCMPYYNRIPYIYFSVEKWIIFLLVISFEQFVWVFFLLFEIEWIFFQSWMMIFVWLFHSFERKMVEKHPNWLKLYFFSTYSIQRYIVVTFYGNSCLDIVCVPVITAHFYIRKSDDDAHSWNCKNVRRNEKAFAIKWEL